MKYIAAMLLVLASMGQSVYANLLVSPTRIAFEDRDRVKDVILINVTDKTRSYRIEWQENTADERGAYTTIPENELTFASSEFIRYSPRQVTLKPGERQIIKLMLRRKSNMDLPEYRSHLKMTALPPTAEQKAQNTEQGIGFKIDVLTSYTIPVIVRTQAIDAKVEITDVKVKVNSDNKAFFEVAVDKIGSTSVSGEFNVMHLDNKTAKETKVGILRGINIFHENQRRVVDIEWQNFSAPESGTFKIIFKGTNEQTGQELSSTIKEIRLTDFSEF